MSYYYLILDILTIAFPLAWTWEKRMSFYRYLKPLFWGIVLANLIFIPWDIWFTHKGIWGFNPNYYMGFKLGPLPIEEWLWFVVTPYACFFIYEALRYFVKQRVLRKWKSFHVGLAGLFIFIGVGAYPLWYTSFTFFLTGLLLLISIKTLPKANWFNFWLTYLVCLLPFFIFNSALTGLFTAEPVVWYNTTYFLRIRIGTIPMEDGIYLLLYLLLIYQVYGRYTQNEIK